MKRRLLKFLKTVYCSDEVIGRDSFFTDFEPAVLKERKGFVQEIAGRDSIAALKKHLEGGNDYEFVVLSVAFSPTEYGELQYPLKAIETAYEIAAGTGLEVLISVSKSSEIWKRLVSNNMIEISQRCGFFSPCIACHLYLHILRGLIAFITGAGVVVSGERIYHGEKIKINQALPSINAYADVLKTIGVELLFPVLDVREEGSILKLLPSKWEEGKEQMNCLFSGTSKLTGASYESIRVSLERYIKDWMIPAGKEILLESVSRLSE